MDLKGNDLQAIFEHGATLKNGILQVSKGIQMSYDETLPMEKRVNKLLIKGEAVDPKKSYRIVTNNFLADGGDGFLAFKNGTNKKNTQMPILETLVKYLKTFEPYKPKIEGREVKEK